MDVKTGQITRGHRIRHRIRINKLRRNASDRGTDRNYYSALIPKRTRRITTHLSVHATHIVISTLTCRVRLFLRLALIQEAVLRIRSTEDVAKGVFQDPDRHYRREVLFFRFLRIIDCISLSGKVGLIYNRGKLSHDDHVSQVRPLEVTSAGVANRPTSHLGNVGSAGLILRRSQLPLLDRRERVSRKITKGFKGDLADLR